MKDAQVSALGSAPDQKDLPSVSISRLVAAGEVTKDALTVVVTLAGAEHEVRVVRRHFPNGGFWVFFVCPGCGRRARTLKPVDGFPACQWCCDGHGVVRLVARSSRADRREARARRIGTLIEALNSGPARLRPRPGRRLDRRRALALSLKRALLP